MSGSDTTSGGSPDSGGGVGGSGSGDGGGGADVGFQPYPDPGADTGTNGLWAVSSVLPQTGVVDTENFVQLVGSFPEQPTVWLDDSAADTIFYALDLIVVATRRHATAGLVDVSLRRQNEQVLVLPDSFAFLPAAGDRPAGDDSTGPEAGSDWGDGGSRNGEDDAKDGPPSGSTADDPTGSGGPSDDGDSPVGAGDSGSDSEPSDRQPRPVADGESVVLPGGLSGVPASGLNFPGSTPLCGPGPCRAAPV